MEHEGNVKTGVSEETEVTEVSLEALASRTLKLERLSSDFQDKCVICGLQGRMDWQATFHDQTWGLLCGDCGEKLGMKLQEVT
jgi:hypothetical protein